MMPRTEDMKAKFIAAVLLVAAAGYWGFSVVEKEERVRSGRLSAPASSTPRTDYRVLVVDPLHAQSLAAEIVRQSAPATPVKSGMKKAHRRVHPSFVDTSAPLYEDLPAPLGSAARLAL